MLCSYLNRPVKYSRMSAQTNLGRNRVKKCLNFSDDYRFQMHQFLGRGSYAVVMSARDVKNDRYAAIKIVWLKNKDIHKNALEAGGDSSRIKKNLKLLTQKEAEIMFKLKPHPNIVEISNYFEGSEHIYLVLELCTNMTLNHLIKNDQITFSNAMIKKFLFEIATGCQYMHANLVIHRDLKPDNILLNGDYQAKIGDFGLAVCLKSPDEILLKYCGTPRYQAPEMLERRGYSFGVDVWAIGCIAYRLFYGNPPFSGSSIEEICKATLHGKAKCPRISRYDHPIDNEEIRVIKSLLVKDPSKRIKIHELLQRTKFFADKYPEDYPFMIKRLLVPDPASKELHYKYERMIRDMKAIRNYHVNKRIRISYLSFNDCQLMPKHWIHQWIEIKMFGFGYYFGSDFNMFGFNFKDKTKMMMQHKIIFYLEQAKLHRFESEKCPYVYGKKLEIMQRALNVILRSQTRNNQSKAIEHGENSINLEEIPWLKKWIQTKDEVMVFQLETRLVQITFSQQNKVFLFDPQFHSMTIVNLNNMKSLTIGLKNILKGNVTEHMQKYIGIALQYIKLLNNDTR